MIFRNTSALHGTYRDLYLPHGHLQRQQSVVTYGLTQYIKLRQDK